VKTKGNSELGATAILGYEPKPIKEKLAGFRLE